MRSSQLAHLFLEREGKAKGGIASDAAKKKNGRSGMNVVVKTTARPWQLVRGIIRKEEKEKGAPALVSLFPNTKKEGGGKGRRTSLSPPRGL